MKLTSGFLYGSVLSNTSVAGLTLTETSYAPSLELPRHSHEQAYFCFVLEGGFTEIYGRRSRSCRPSTLVFHPSEEAHSDKFHTGARCFNIQMSPRWIKRVQESAPVLDTPSDFHDKTLAYLAKRLYNEFRHGDDLSSLVIEGLALELIAASTHCARNAANHRPHRWLIQALEIIDESLCEPLTLASIAGSVGVHPVHLSREFRRYYRCTVGEYIRMRRIEFACNRLASSSASMSEIALSAGFFDQSHFARTFKLLVGTTPKRYRDRLRPR